MTRRKAPAPAPAAPVPLEPFGPLSSSVIWQIERTAYQQSGIDSWRLGRIPHYVTTTPFIANAYARMVLAHLRDLEAAGHGDDPRPVTVLELGAGPGRFGHGLLRRLTALHASSRLRRPFRYVMADLAEDNVKWWQEHPDLRPFVEAGVLDFARFDVEHDGELTLEVSGDRLGRKRPQDAGIVIANYLFDSIPPDCFQVEAGRLVEAHCRAVSTQEEPDLHAEGVLGRVTLEYQSVDVPPDRYGDPALNEVLAQYAERLATATVTVPALALSCLGRLRDLFGGKLLVLSGDKGFHREDEVLQRAAPEIVEHGPVFSLMVNFDAFRRWFEATGGVALHPARQPASLDVSAFAAGWRREELVETASAFEDQVETLSPDDYFVVLHQLGQRADVLDAEGALALLRFSGWDAEVLLRTYETFSAVVGQASSAMQEEMAWSLHQVWDAYFPIGESADVASVISNLFFTMGYHSEALEYLEHSRTWYGDSAQTLYNMALCQHLRGFRDEAVTLARQATELDPTFDPAKALRLRLETEQSRQRVRRADR